MRTIAAGLIVLAAAACAMQPARSGPWPPLPTTLPAAAPLDIAAAMPARAVRPAAAPAPAQPASLLSAWPEGWRAPNDAELSGAHVAHRGDSPSAYLSAQGDFNGDGQADRAVLLVSEARNQYGVFVLDGRPGSYPVLVGGPATAVEGMGLAADPARGLTFFVFGSSRFQIRWDGTAYAVAVAE